MERAEPGAGGHHEERHFSVLGAHPADLRIKALSIDAGDDGAAFDVNDVDFSTLPSHRKPRFYGRQVG